jgi:LuxR family maltose regulon positive regulatory protein
MMDTLASPLVITKLHPPASRPRNILRVHLLDLFAPEDGKGFVLVSAPAGYGKTTLLGEHARSLLRNDVAVAWYALDSSDDDPITFGLYLIASLTQALGEISELATISQRLCAATEIDLQVILPSVINFIALSERNCTLILDDYHLISSPAIHSAMAFLLEHLPQNLRVIIGSRADPPLPLARLRARGNMLEIRTADLRFTVDETTLFLNEVMALGLSADEVAALEARTEGWIAGLQLAALSLAGQTDKESYIASFTGSHRYLVEYLLEEVVERQPQEVQSFLLATSILERMCAPLCDAILGENFDSAAILDHLEQANLFVIALDEQSCWYRYHHLFGDFLQARLLKNQAERVPSLHKAACEWLTAHGDLREAARHAFRVGDWEYAAAFIEQHSFNMVIHSEISTIYEWCSAFPEEVMQNHPTLCLHQCWALVFSFQRQNRSRVEARLRQVEEVIAAMVDKKQAGDLAEHAAVVRSFLVMTPDQTANPHEQLVRAQSMLVPYPEGDPGQFSALLLMGYAYMALADAEEAVRVLQKARQVALNGRLFYGVVESTFHLARLAHHQGRLRVAAELCRQGRADVTDLLGHTEPERRLPALGCLDIALSCVLLEQNHLNEAERCLQNGLALLGRSSNPCYLLTAYIALYRLNAIRGKSEEALACLARLEEAWPDISFCIRGLRIVHTLRIKQPDESWLAEAEAWLESFSLTNETPLPGMGPFGAAEVYYLAYRARAEVQIAAGRVLEALSYLERQLKLAVANGLIGRVIELSLLKAQAARVEGDHQRAFRAIERALVAAQSEGYLRSFDQGARLNGLLVEAANAGICREYVEQILAALGGVTANTIRSGIPLRLSQLSDMGVAEELSERELEVLLLMAQGATNQAIAEKLVITVGTVKSHINHIMGKLGAHNRTEAVARARRFGLISI